MESWGRVGGYSVDRRNKLRLVAIELHLTTDIVGFILSHAVRERRMSNGIGTNGQG
jgi:acyl-CoA hydrolase